MVMVLRRVCVLAEAAATPAGQHNTTTIVRQKNCANELHTQALGMVCDDEETNAH
jgi:hypothetical protein